MSISTKYGKTFHYDFSPGTTSDDRINRKWREEVQKFDTIIHTEKLDGENTCLSELGVFARSHAAPTLHPWADHLKIKQSMMKHDLKDNNLEIFGENLYAIHSIIYPKLEHHLIIGAGLDTSNVAEQLPFADGAIVGSCFKPYKRTQEMISRELVKEFMTEVKKIR